MAKLSVPEVTRGVVAQQPRETVSHLNAVQAYLKQLGGGFATQAQAESGAADVSLNPAIAAFLAAMPKAFVLFDASSGTPVINMSYNVASITDRGVGFFTINFTSPFSSNAIGMVGAANNGGFGLIVGPDLAVTPTASAFPIQVHNAVGTLIDAVYIFIAFYGDLA